MHSAADAGALAAVIARRSGVDVVGVMFYEAQVAGLPDSSPAVRAVKRLSIKDLAVRRAAVVDAVQSAVGHELSLVNSGGSGSVASSAADPVVTEVTAGSGLFVPTLFDAYRSFTPRPAAFFGLDVVRIPGPGFATVFGGGYIASGPATKSRQPRPVWPTGLALTSREGAGEVQTPLRLSSGADLRVGRPGVVPARQGRRGHGALRAGPPGPRHHDRVHGPHVPRRAPLVRLTAPSAAHRRPRIRSLWRSHPRTSRSAARRPRSVAALGSAASGGRCAGPIGAAAVEGVGVVRR